MAVLRKFVLINSLTGVDGLARKLAESILLGNEERFRN